MRSTTCCASACRAPGLRVSGTSPDERLVEVIELEDHPFFVASQFHPEFKSRPERPAPLFRDFVTAALERSRPAARGPAAARRLRRRGGSQIHGAGVPGAPAGRS